MKMDPNHFMWWFSEIDRNRVTVLVNDVEELTNIELSEASQRIRKSDFSCLKMQKQIKLDWMLCRIEESNSALRSC
jgi:F0F1-type ATP synthase epsilon subunit